MDRARLELSLEHLLTVAETEFASIERMPIDDVTTFNTDMINLHGRVLSELIVHVRRLTQAVVEVMPE